MIVLRIMSSLEKTLLPEPILTLRTGAILTLTLSRAEKMNALSRATLDALRAAFENLDGDQDLRCVVLRNAGNRYFAAGGDVHELATVRTPLATEAMAERGRLSLDAIRDCPVPVVAVLNGDAIGGGAELAVAADFRVMREGSRIGFIQGRLGICSAWGGGPDLAALVGPARALRMTTRCELIDAETALDWGLADAIASEAALDEAVARFVEPIVSQSPRALRACLAQSRAMRRGVSYEERRTLERQHLLNTWLHDDHWAAVERLFARKS
ncbi:MAG: enoyl-CoA hydratase/isomerase family protein [Gammaproteobacteria bacterium]